MSIQKMEHIGIFVRNMEESVAFYRDVLGFQAVGTLDIGNPEVDIVLMSLPESPEVQIELVCGPNQDVATEGLVNHLAFTVADLEAEVERLRGLNISFMHESPTILANGVRYIFFYGPSGEHLELFQPAR